MEADHVNVEHPTEELVTRLGEGGGGGTKGRRVGIRKAGVGSGGGGGETRGSQIGQGCSSHMGAEVAKRG